MLKVDSLLSIGLYKIDLWELEASAKLFKQVINLAQNTDHHSWAEKASICLALVNSYLGLNEAAYLFADVAYETIIDEIKQTGKFTYFIQILGQTYLNLGNYSKANDLLERALSFAEESHYTQVKAKTLNSLAQMHHLQNQFELALYHHNQAIELLDKIGAKCDLAVAYFQLGLTYQKMSQIEAGKIAFARAIQLFNEMQAPKQIERVRSSEILAIQI